MKNNNQQNNLYNLIEEITPYYNDYRDLIHSQEHGSEILQLMWKVGDILESYMDKDPIKPHNLYWQIYGKAQGVKTSYITRDFLSYCYRIKKYFLTKENIIQQFPRLQRYSLFREAFPLLENSKYKLSNDETIDLIALLNSSYPPIDIKQKLVSLKGKIIGIKNNRMQKLHEMEPYTKNFVLIYNEIYTLIKNNDTNEIQAFILRMRPDYLKDLVSLITSFTEEGLYVPETKSRDDVPSLWQEFIDNLIKLTKGKVEDRNRFRRLLTTKKINNLAEMINAFIVPQGITHFRERKNIQ